MSFDRVAPHYRWLEAIAFGGTLQRARTFFVREAKSAKCVLIVGEGNGRFLLELLRENPNSEVDCVDASARMLDLARYRVDDALPERIGQVRFIKSAIEDWQLPNYRYDLIVTHFLLDCFTASQLQTVVAKLAEAAASDATWLVADFSYPSSRFHRLRAHLWIAAMYYFFRAVAGIEARNLSNPSPFLSRHGFSCVDRKEFRTGLVKSEMWKRVA